MATLDVVTSVALREAPQTLDVVTAVSLSVGSSTTRDVVTEVTLMSAALEPFTPLSLPGGRWTQTAGPAAPPPAVLVPAVPNPGATLTYQQANGTQFTFKVLPHSFFQPNSAGVLRPVRRRPSPIVQDFPFTVSDNGDGTATLTATSAVVRDYGDGSGTVGWTGADVVDHGDGTATISDTS